jgi:small subunit ribosomal protein S3
MKQFCEQAMNAGARGVKIMCSGRLAGAEIARREMQKLGSIPLHTLDADVDYATARAETTYGTIGIKVWIHKGNFGEQPQARQPHRRRPFRRAEVAGGEVTTESAAAERSGQKPKPAEAKPESVIPPEAQQPEGGNPQAG